MQWKALRMDPQRWTLPATHSEAADLEVRKPFALHAMIPLHATRRQRLLPQMTIAKWPRHAQFKGAKRI